MPAETLTHPDQHAMDEQSVKVQEAVAWREHDSTGMAGSGELIDEEAKKVAALTMSFEDEGIASEVSHDLARDIQMLSDAADSRNAGDALQVFSLLKEDMSKLDNVEKHKQSILGALEASAGPEGSRFLEENVKELVSEAPAAEIAPEATADKPAPAAEPYLLSDDERYKLTQMQKELLHGSVPDELSVKRDWSDTAAQHAEKQQANIEAFRADADAALTEHDALRAEQEEQAAHAAIEQAAKLARQEEAQQAKERAQAHYEATTAALDASRAEKSEEQALADKEYFKLKLQNGGDIGVKSLGLEDSLRQQAQDSAAAQVGRVPEVTAAPTETEQRQQAAAERQSEYGQMLKNFDREAGAAALEKQAAPSADPESDSSAKPGVESAPSEGLVPDEPVEEVSEQKLLSRYDRLKQRMRDGNLSLNPRIGERYSKIKERLNEEPRRRAVAVLLAATTMLGAMGFLASAGSDAESIRPVALAEEVREESEAETPSLPAPELATVTVESGEGTSHVANDTLGINFSSEAQWKEFNDRTNSLFENVEGVYRDTATGEFRFSGAANYQIPQHILEQMMEIANEINAR